MTLIKHLFLLIVFILCFGYTKAQTYYYKNYTVDNGLPSSEVFHVIQDMKGFIWIATNQGVSRYDGYGFTNFDTQSSLPRNTILELFEDNKGRIWFVSLSGELSWFENDSIHIYPYNDVILEFNKGNLGRPLKKSFYADSLNEVYIGFNSNPLIKISSDGNLTKIKPEKNTHRQVLKVLSDRNLVFSSYRAVEGIEVQIEDEPDLIIPGKYPYVRRFIACCVDEGYIFVTLYDLYVINKEGTVTKHTFNKKIIWVSQDSEGVIWLGFLWGGSVGFDGINFSEKKYSLLEDKSVSSVTRDKEGGYWFSTTENGLYYFPSLQIKTFNEINGRKIKSVNQTERLGDEIWFVGNTNEKYKISNGNLVSKESVYKSNGLGQFTLLKSIGDSMVCSFYGDSEDNINIVFNNEIVWSMDEETRDAAVIGLDSLLITYNHIKVVSLNDETIYNKSNSDKFTDIYAVLRASKTKVWLGTENGLFEYSIKSNEIKELNFSPLLRTRINCFFKEKEGEIWVGTKGAGLLYINGDSIKQLTTKDGLPGNSVNRIDKKNNILWLATNHGIGKVFLNQIRENSLNDSDWNTLKIEGFTRSNGLLNNEIFDLALDKEKVYAGTNSGLSYFNQNLSGDNNVVPPIYFKGIKVMGKDTILKDYYELNYDQNYIEFSFVGLSYQRELGLKYAYKLEGINSDWVFTENQSVQYPMLPPGNYKFKVKAYNRSGLESEKTKEISLVIKKVYYQTTLFKIVVILLILLIVTVIFIFIYTVKIKEVKKRNTVVAELNTFRQKALSAQMNPHFIYNSLNSVQSYILKNERELSSTYLSKFGSLMRRILENSQSPLISLHEEIEALKLYIEMELLRFRDSFSFHLSIDKNLDSEKIKVPPLIIQPYVENAIHHGLRMKKEDKNLWINISRNEDAISIVIEDDGIGRKEALRIRNESNERLKSFGTEITDKRLSLFKELYKNDLDIKIVDIGNNNDKNKTGTRVEICIFKFNNNR